MISAVKLIRRALTTTNDHVGDHLLASIKNKSLQRALYDSGKQLRFKHIPQILSPFSPKWSEEDLLLGAFIFHKDIPDFGMKVQHEISVHLHPSCHNRTFHPQKVESFRPQTIAPPANLSILRYSSELLLHPPLQSVMGNRGGFKGFAYPYTHVPAGGAVPDVKVLDSTFHVGDSYESHSEMVNDHIFAIGDPLKPSPKNHILDGESNFQVHIFPEEIGASEDEDEDWDWDGSYVGENYHTAGIRSVSKAETWDDLLGRISSQKGAYVQYSIDTHLTVDEKAKTKSTIEDERRGMKEERDSLLGIPELAY